MRAVRGRNEVFADTGVIRREKEDEGNLGLQVYPE